MAKVLTLYFSMKGETIAPGMKIVNLEKGTSFTGSSVEQLKEQIQKWARAQNDREGFQL